MQKAIVDECIGQVWENQGSPGTHTPPPPPPRGFMDTEDLMRVSSMLTSMTTAIAGAAGLSDVTGTLTAQSIAINMCMLSGWSGCLQLQQLCSAYNGCDDACQHAGHPKEIFGIHLPPPPPPLPPCPDCAHPESTDPSSTKSSTIAFWILKIADTRHRLLTSLKPGGLDATAAPMESIVHKARCYQQTVRRTIEHFVEVHAFSPGCMSLPLTPHIIHAGPVLNRMLYFLRPRHETHCNGQHELSAK